jgi:hypothetical protein
MSLCRENGGKKPVFEGKIGGGKFETGFKMLASKLIGLHRLDEQIDDGIHRK